MSATLLHIDSRKRITLPSNAKVSPGEDLEVEILKDGRMLLTPIVRVPKHQLWAWAPEVDQLLEEAAADNSPLVRFGSRKELEDLRKRLVDKQ